uniref:Serine/threonine-protein phosphatase n=1 Tax=Rhabditophanes sp. KR3021 TaxID=114890 RepID=A0AC35TPV3_9BILA
MDPDIPQQTATPEVPPGIGMPEPPADDVVPTAVPEAPLIPLPPAGAVPPADEPDKIKQELNSPAISEMYNTDPFFSAKESQEVIMKRIESYVKRLYKDWKSALATCLFAEKEILEIVYRARECFWQSGLLIHVPAGVTVDLLVILNYNGMPPAAKYLFLGDYIDRGPFSLEVICLLFCLKILYPDEVTLLRGNHESRPVNVMYGFRTECVRRYSAHLYDLFQTAFANMPFSALIEKRILCMHGGISEDLVSLDQFNAIERPCDIPDLGKVSHFNYKLALITCRLISDLTWADPDPVIQMYEESHRGASRVFGAEALNKFLNQMKIDLVIRGHQVVQEGFEFFNDRKLVTIFSAPTIAINSTTQVQF